MTSPRARLAVLACWAAIILMGTLAPYRFGGPAYASAKLTRVAWNPVRTVIEARPRRTVRDAVINIGLFLPFGFAVGRVVRGRGRGRRIWRVVLAGSLFSVGIETAQLFTIWRFPAVHDVILNTLGALAGGLWEGRRARRALLDTGGAVAPAA
ncbi:MAG: VanZ family protein [Acidimicrobiia bacterium]|nr:VanZ family protein [Acidimicrobiia bacterium]